VRTIVASFVSFASLAIFAFGLIAPLTPSEGCPSVGEVVAFAAIPAALPSAALFLVPSPLLKTILLLQSAGVVAFAVHVLSIGDCLP
jgi:hypothetical protein